MWLNCLAFAHQIQVVRFTLFAMKFSQGNNTARVWNFYVTCNDKYHAESPYSKVLN